MNVALKWKCSHDFVDWRAHVFARLYVMYCGLFVVPSSAKDSSNHCKAENHVVGGLAPMQGGLAPLSPSRLFVKKRRPLVLVKAPWRVCTSRLLVEKRAPWPVCTSRLLAFLAETRRLSGKKSGNIRAKPLDLHECNGTIIIRARRLQPPWSKIVPYAHGLSCMHET